jgi:hypothetical protein
MSRNDIERILRLQGTAYELLLWLNKRAENDQEILSDHQLEKWLFAESCETWVRDVCGMFPQVLRPSQEDIPAFARLFSSFFQTFFRVVGNAPTLGYDCCGCEGGYVASGKRKLMAGAPGGKKSAKGKAKIGASAHELRLIALEELALENDLLVNRADLLVLDKDDELREAMVLWTYFHELNRRANFASQGEAVRSLWQAMDKKERERMNADKIIKARDRLVAALKSR